VERVYEEAFCEVDEIIKLMPIDLKSKIPIQFTDIIEKNKASNYKVEIQEPLQEQQLKEETITILGLIYRDFLASPEEKERLQRQDAEKLKQLEQEITEQYDMQNVFANKKKKKIKNNEEENNSLVVYKETNIFKRLVAFIKGFFLR